MGLFGSVSNWLGGRLGGAPAPPSAAQVTALIGPPRRHLDPTQDHILSDVFSPPYRGPGELDNYGGETAEMRRRYRDQHRTSPILRAAIEGKADDLAALKATVLSADKDDALSNAAAKFVDWTIGRAPGGWGGLVDSLYRPATIDGWSVCEKKLRPQAWQGRRVWGLAHVRSLDTVHMRLQLDVYRNVVGVVNVLRGLEHYDPAQVVLYTHRGMFGNPFGQSDARAAVRGATMIEDVYKVWYVAMKVYGLPYMKGKAGAASNRKALEASLRALRDGGWVVLGKDDEIEVLDLAAGAAVSGFESLIRTQREDIFYAVRKAALPFMEGKGTSGAHGDTEVEQGTSDAGEKRDADRIADVINQQLIPWLCAPNFDLDESRYPTVRFGGTNWKQIKEVIGVVREAQEAGLEPSAEWVHEATSIPAARDDDDRLVTAAEKQQQQQQAAQQPGAAPGAAPALAPPAGDGPPPAAFSDAPGHKYACVFLPLAGPAADLIRGMAARIPDDALADRGREAEPHVTARFGLHADDPAEAVRLVRGFGPVAMRFGRPTVFRGAEGGKPYDVVKLDVDSPDLVRLHGRLAALPHTDTHPDFRPHATVAYVKAGLGQLVADRLAYPRTGPTETATAAVFSGRDRVKTTIPLGPPPAAATFSDGADGRAAVKAVRAALAALPDEDLDGLYVYARYAGPQFWIDQMDWHTGRGGKAAIAAAKKAAGVRDVVDHKPPPGDGPAVCVFNEGPKPDGPGWVDLTDAVLNAPGRRGKTFSDAPPPDDAPPDAERVARAAAELLAEIAA